MGLTAPAITRTRSENFKFNYDSAYGHKGLSRPYTGPTTITGLHTLEHGGVRTTLMNAVEAATRRSRELGEALLKRDER